MMGLLSWWRRKIVVEQAHPDYPSVKRILIDEGDGSKPQELLLSRNNLCSLAWACQEFWKAEKTQGRIRDVSFTLKIPRGGPNGEDETHVLTIPDWATHKFYRAVIAGALEVGWKGEVYHPTPTAWEHLLRDDGL